MRTLCTIVLLSAGLGLAACNGNGGDVTPQTGPQVGDDCTYKDRHGIEMKGVFVRQDVFVFCGPTGNSNR